MFIIFDFSERNKSNENKSHTHHQPKNCQIISLKQLKFCGGGNGFWCFSTQVEMKYNINHNQNHKHKPKKCQHFLQSKYTHTQSNKQTRSLSVFLKRLFHQKNQFVQREKPNECLSV
jgi:hypothetical protein